MPEPLAICLEDLDAVDPELRYLRCVALPGNEPGLTIDGTGAVLWRGAGACELWISADDRLVLLRREGSGEVTVDRAGRTLQAPCAKPVILIDGDQIGLGGRRFRVHVHGAATHVHPPEPLPESTVRRLVQAAAAALALTAGSVAALAQPEGVPPPQGPVEVREHPPKPSMPRDPPPSPSPSPSPSPLPQPFPSSAPNSSATSPTTGTAATSVPSDRRPIEVRQNPPAPMPQRQGVTPKRKP
jgi:predicted component of type VI protein secretion system